jgi:hypothetical protein
VLDSLLRQVWTYSTALGMSRVAIGINGRHQVALAMMIDDGFRVARAAVRMVRTPAPPEVFAPTDALDASRWAG